MERGTLCLNNQKIKKMHKLAVYESGEGKKHFAISNYYRSDYIGLALIKNFFLTTIAYGLLLMIYFGYRSEYFMENIHKMNLVFIGRRGDWAVYYSVSCLQYSDICLLFCEVFQSTEGNPGILQRSDADEESLRPRGKKKRKNYREEGENKRMTVLLELKQKIKEFYSEHDVLLLSVFKFFLAFLYFNSINSSLGFMEKLDNIFIVLILSIICAVLPVNVMTVIGCVLIVLHCYAVGLEVAGFAALLIILLLILFLRFTSEDNLALVLTPAAFRFHISAAVPIGEDF